MGKENVNDHLSHRTPIRSIFSRKLSISVAGMLACVATTAHAELPGQQAWQAYTPSALSSLDARFGDADQSDMLSANHLFGVSGDARSNYGEFSYFSSRAEDVMNSRGEPEFQRSTMSITQQLGDTSLHFGSAVTDDEYRIDTGFTIGRATFSVSAGRGSGTPTLDRAMGFIDPDFFYGGNGVGYDVTGGTMSLAVGGNLAAQAGYYEVTSDDLDDRSSSVLGLSGGSWRANLVQIQRGKDTAGHGFDFGLQRGAMHASFSGITTQTDAYSTKLSVGMTSRNDNVFGFELQQDRNPLYREDDDTRVLLTVSGLFGKPRHSLMGVNHIPNPEDEQEAKAKRRNRAFGIGIGVAAGVGVAAALSSSSGDSDSDNSLRFNTAQRAAFSALSGVNPRSVRENREYGGYVYRRQDGSFSFNGPIKGEIASVNLGDPESSVPSGTRTRATYHTHGGPDPRFDNENFSPQDISLSRRLQVDGFLGTPAGFMKRYNVATDGVTTIARIPNQ